MLDKTDRSAVNKFNNFVLSHGDITQTTYWGEVKTNWCWEGVYLEDNGEITASMLLLIRKLPIVNANLAYSSKGPVCNIDNAGQFKALLAEAQPLKKKYHLFTIKFDPEALCTEEYKKHFKDMGFTVKCDHRHLHDYAQPKFNMVLTLTGKTEDELVAEFSNKTRYNLRLSYRKGVTVFWTNDEGSGKRFHEIYEITAMRDNFSYRSAEYFEHMLKIIPKENIRIYFTKHEDDVLSSAVCIKSGDKMWYMYGASSNEKRNLMPNYAMQWEMIKWALECGCDRYDFGGVFVLDKENGLFKFKKGFCDKEDVREYLGEIDMVYNPFYFFAYDKILPFMQGFKRKLFKLFKK
ncbi:MAG: peptidoglycan bridge formation glycyltransferase FemA/FemB family protein [Bacillota bacterium]|nr:peptidoglycan bridge formation glycyltransferase FemA/FemB family protein [Bacillota bacterium]